MAKTTFNGKTYKTVERKAPKMTRQQSEAFIAQMSQGSKPKTKKATKKSK